MKKFDIDVKYQSFEQVNHEDIIRFLNTGAVVFYQDGCRFNQSIYKNYFKGNLQSAVVDIERTIRGTFGCDLLLESVRLDLFKEMFPNAVNNIFKVKTQEDLKDLSAVLMSFRNINSHAVVAKDKLFFKYFDFSHLEEQPKFNPKLVYFDKGITIAGMIFVIANFLRKESLNSLIKKDYIFSYVISGSFKLDDGVRFIEQISKVNLEMPIRTNSSDDLKESIFGEMSSLIKTDNDTFECSIGQEDLITYRVKGIIGNSSITINAGSLTRITYKKDYTLVVLDKEGFVELSNQLPAFTLVDYLYAKNISVFDKDEYNKILEKFNLIEKLNHPKYYVDKNLIVILLPETISDYRTMSSVICDSLQRIFLAMEDYIYFNYIKKEPKEYSLFKEALEAIGVPTELASKVRILRNLASHGYLINESSISNYDTQELTIPFIISTLEELSQYIKDNNSQFHLYFARVFRSIFIEVLSSFKYKKISITSREILKNYPNHDLEELKTRNLYVERTIIDILELNKLSEINDCKPTIIKVDIKSMPCPLYVTTRNKDVLLIQQFCENTGFEVKKVINQPAQITYFIE